LRPDSSTTTLPNPGVNIFLYEVVPNAQWRNSDLPTRNSDGSLIRRPQAALDLHYLFTFYGDESKLEPQLLMGSVMRTIHAQPVLTRQQIQSAIGSSLYSSILGASNLADDFELVKFSPLSLSLEELSKLWSVFFEVDYALSVAYQGTTVLIESDDVPQATLPVRKPLVYVLPFSYPSIAQVQPQMIEFSTAASITVIGSNLFADPNTYTNTVLINNMAATPNPPLQNGHIAVPLPAGIAAGLSTVQVVQRPQLGDPPKTHPGGFESNVAALMILPKLSSATFGTYPTQLLPNVGETGPSVPRPGIKVDVAPLVSTTQQLSLLLNQVSDPPSASPLSFTLQARHRDADTDPIIFDAPNVPPSTYLARIRVDGAVSNLVIDTDPSHTTFNMPIAPTVTVT
jgi:hypothetical protein